MWWVVLLSAKVGMVWSYSMGAPSTTCSTMFPVHSGSPAQTTQPPYFFQLSKTTFTPGETLSVNLVGNGVILRGYQIQARDGNGNVVGQFTSAAGARTITCGLENGALTHSNARNKQGVSFTWQAPTPAVGGIQFIATVVQTYNVFWLNVNSPQITAVTVPPTLPPQPPTTMVVTVPSTRKPPVTLPPETTTSAAMTEEITTQAPTIVTTDLTQIQTQTTPASGRVTMDDTCGTSKGCFVSCEGDSCEYVVTWKHGPEYVDFEVSSKIEIDGVHWIAIAFSNDVKMYFFLCLAILMIIAWILCTGIGIVAARYYKPVWTATNVMGQRIWFQIHRTCMVTALVLTLIGFVIIFVEAGGYSQIPKIEGKEYLQAHPPLGIIVTILAIINPIMSIFRPGPKDEKRPIFNWAHWSVGMLAHILSIIAICFGMEMKKSTAPSYSVWVVVGYVIYHVIMEITLKSFDLYLNRSDPGRIDALGMTNTGVSAQNGNHFKAPPAYTERDTVKPPKDSTVKKILLIFHMAIATAFTVTLVLLVALYD
ncbi:putative ferric-chelate reductase 1 homolog [Ylistrum balloti]|uniref:putative ferric-chelate reductase 1 homolog n=1 Tax=Ylistrum balloti TaxID=509963 RepID=UPI0029058680|nr:putative ferric-chelate reductase 1 homolog [Ylistrum balloti]